MTTTTLRPVTSAKFGVSVPANQSVEVTCKESHVSIKVNETVSLSVSYHRAFLYLKGFRKPPTLAKLEKYTNDSFCSTPTGKRVEPDGHDENGCPSWLLVMGLI